MRLLKDLGMLHPTESSNYTVRYGLYKCPVCNKAFKTMTQQVKRKASTKCRSCATKIQRSGEEPGKRGTPIYNVWANMKTRCYYTEHEAFNSYGGKGIIVCKEWLNNSKAFMEWALANGYEEGLQIDKDELSYKLGIDPPIYSPETCQFVTRQRNIEIRNELKCV